MKRISVKQGLFKGRRIRIYCDCDKGRKFFEIVHKPHHCNIVKEACLKCQMFPWTFSKLEGDK